MGLPKKLMSSFTMGNPSDNCLSRSSHTSLWTRFWLLYTVTVFLVVKGISCSIRGSVKLNVWSFLGFTRLLLEESCLAVLFSLTTGKSKLFYQTVQSCNTDGL